ncbi:hypothetical protein MNB_SV-3-1510 [hydrothermal vent metagenome]|uniref:Uncharacterized protein n=1 Tax=hydrothermal vent metagenome TaxID=652676 RepID=A0A1W1CET1_9ZZZZ
MMKIIFFILVTLSLLSSNETFEEIKDAYFKSYHYEHIGKYAEAIKTLAPLTKKYPKGYTLNLRLAWLFYLKKHYSTATAYYQKASLLKTQAFEPKLGLIRINLATCSFEKAQNIATEILKVDYYNYYANLYMAKSLIAQKKYKIANSIITKMLIIYPTDILFLEQLFLSYQATNDIHAHDVYQSILILDPNNVLVGNTL